jgi:hypothetical protein
VGGVKNVPAHGLLTLLVERGLLAQPLLASGVLTIMPAVCLNLDGIGIDTMSLGTAIGLTRVIAIRDRKSIKTDELVRPSIQHGEWILLKTHNSDHC